MGGRGASSGVGISARAGRTLAQDKAIKKYARQTANLKKEQYRIIDSNGNVVLVKKGKEHEVAATVGEKRDYLDGNISLHNHPNGGTFSDADLGDFGYGAKEIVVSSKEGTYRLINNKYGTKDAASGWYDMRDDLRQKVVEPMQKQSSLARHKQAQENTRNNSTYKQMQTINKNYEKISKEKGKEAAMEYARKTADKYNELSKKRQQEVAAEERRLLTKPYDDYYKKNAKKYGFTYKFEKK